MRTFAKHTTTGDIYLVDIDTDDGDTVTAVGGPYEDREIRSRDGRDGIGLGHWAHHIDDFDLTSEDVSWAEDQFNRGMMRCISRADV